MRGTEKSRTFGFLKMTLEAIAKAAASAGEIDREALALLADASARADQWNRDTRALTRQDAAMLSRQLTSSLVKAAPVSGLSGLSKAMLMQGLALERYLSCDYRGATSAANDGYHALR